MATYRPGEPPRALERRFARRMAPVAAVVALAMALVPPAMYLWASRSELESSAETAAVRVAEAVQAVAARQPWLWRYNLPKVLQATAGYRALDAIGTVEITDCRGGALVTGRELELGSGETEGPTGWAPVVARGRVVAWVKVVMDERPQRRRAATVAAASTALGTLLGLLLFVLPVTVVRRQAGDLQEVVARLTEAEVKLKGANAALQERVAEAVGKARALSARVISIQEEERARLARDLHDGLGQLLAALDIELQLAEREAGEAAHIREARDICETTLTELRRAVRDLQPLELETAPLSEVLAATCERFELRAGVATSFRHVGPEVEDDPIARSLLRVTQEALNNVRRHAEAEEVGVALVVEPGERIALTVRDDGVGFDTARPSGGMGLRSIRERVHYLGGEVDVRSSLEGGTTVAVRLPIPPEATPDP